MQSVMLKLSAIEPNKGQIEGLPKNPRFIKDEKFKKLVKSIEDNPEMTAMRELLVYPLDNGKHIIIGGNMRYRAMKELGVKEVPCKVIPKEATIEQLQAYTLKDNSGYGEWDFDLLANEWDLSMLENCAIDLPDYNVDELLGEETPEAVEDDFDETKDAVESKVKFGEIWQLGEHRLMCGDSTDGECVKTLMGGVLADMAFSSPPYNAGTTATEAAMNKTTKYNGNEDNKPMEEYRLFLNKYLSLAIANSYYCFMNIQSLSNNKLALIDVLADNKHVYADTMIWDKIHGQPAMAHNVLNSVFEYIHIFSKKANRAIGTIDFRGTIDNIFHLQGQRNNEFSAIHNATFSVEFASFFIKNFAKESVLDSFGGTGTTLIACEQLNRKCFMMEFDPHYCDVIIARWEKLTGKQAEKVS